MAMYWYVMPPNWESYDCSTCGGTFTGPHYCSGPSPKQAEWINNTGGDIQNLFKIESTEKLLLGEILATLERIERKLG